MDKMMSIAISSLRVLPREPRIVILMYHSISGRREDHVRSYFTTATSLTRFEEQMQWLAESDLDVVTLNSWNAPFSDVSRFRIIITFDDGLSDFMANAFPVLSSHGYPVTMFLPTGFIETGKEIVPGVKHLRWGEIKDLSAAGVDFGSHSVHHKHFETLSESEIRDEIRNSADSIQMHLCREVTSFSCPFAFPQEYPKVVAALQKTLFDCGYITGVTTNIGAVSLNDDSFSLKRLPVNSDDDKTLFMAKLRGGYDWLSGIQHTFRIAKRLVMPAYAKVR
jgi:peptidoglycan/xylan/chitin deacetylase (PgdA/CDA1 family)